MNLFGGKKDAEKEAMAQNLQNLAEQIAALKAQLNQKNAEISDAKESLSDKDAAASSAQEQTKALNEQLRKLQEALATAEAERMAQELIAKQAQADLQEATASAGAVSGAVVASLGGDATEGGMKPGASAWVTREGGLPLRLRGGPGLEHKVLGQLAPGTQLTLLQGPVDADGYSWWNIRAEDGREGWCAGNDLRTQPD